ncbi:MAG: ABC transporter permease [Rhodobacteraceae bacterium]|nr:ABC transporter permease [Paracoccaceae bacterium]
MTAIPTQPRGRLLTEITRWPGSLKIGTVLFVLICLAGIFAPWLTPYGPNEQDLKNTLVAPSLAHPFGTDNFGRDVFARVLYGIRINLPFGIITTYVPMIYGVVLGALAGYWGGWFDAILMRILDVTVAFPFLVLIIVIVAILGPGIHNIYIAIFLTAWTMYARLARAEMLVERNKDYILAARTLGYGTGRIVFRHALPNVSNSSIIFSTSDFVLNIMLLSGLSFLGLGVAPPTPEWGAMIAEGRDFLFDAWWICTLPGLALVVTGTALCLIGDGLAQRLGERRHALV